MIEKYSNAALAFRVAFIYSKYQGKRTKLSRVLGQCPDAKPIWIVEILENK